MGIGIRKKAHIALALLLALACAACAARAAADAADARAAAAEQAAAEPSAGFSVEGPTGEAVVVLGGEEAARALDSEVAAWCAENVEGAGSARWDRKMSCDFEAGTFELSYLCDDGATEVRVVACPAASCYAVSKEAV